MTSSNVENWINAILQKIKTTYNIQLSPITISEDIDISIQNYCNTLNNNPPKKVIKKKPSEPVSTILETVPTPEEAIQKPKKLIKKKPSEPVSTILETVPTPLEAVSNILETVPAPVEAIQKPKKVIKKKPSEPVSNILETVPTPIEAVSNMLETVPTSEELVQKPKKVIKKKPSEPVSTILETVPTPVEVIQKPKKIIKKVKTIDSEPQVVPEPVKSKQDVENIEYGEDVDCEQATNVYETFQSYDEILLEPREINDEKYYVDGAGYVYDFMNQDLIGKINEKTNQISFLTNFTSTE
jgi:hypothetical protein